GRRPGACRRNRAGSDRPSATDAPGTRRARPRGAFHVAERRREDRQPLRLRSGIVTRTGGLKMADAFPIPKRAMAIVAHPDDVDFGCSGTLAGFIERGTHVTYCLLTSGDKGTHDPKMPPETLAQTREKEQRAAGEAIGVKEFVFLRHHDGELERSMALREEVCLAIRVHKPDLVFTNDPWAHWQIHPDHRVAGWSGMDG